MTAAEIAQMPCCDQAEYWRNLCADLASSDTLDWRAALAEAREALAE